ncbi:alpha-D-ribose 1-methylphosphonate 5-triphosphate diphosphatase [Devosia sp. BSSL-BM10]|uniref:Alpha-D-ribose 1-methylphosphonate 5-triphosphate diphosphatase n=1 Tax=Devosia litorisediminis TaxID=2829817 RepID=A0A942EGU0_9HYPH|nr:alpha-D-ribose 1-methylphosphonate 5-triphosphate diphosphatase [Devosia litorisediminis]MBS3849661.1 alpha-D-ribose 1-methylphosphonate 5-triphosphate diphosphatase [Devosia litorisediminis]
MNQNAFRNARIVLPDSIVEGSLSFDDGMIAGISDGPANTGLDLEGDYLIAGLVELHTDHLENHYRPRPGVFWDPLASLHAHDVQIAGSGITTVFDAVRIGSDADVKDMAPHIAALTGAIASARKDGWLRAEHFVHLRCELPSHDVLEHFEAYATHPETRLASMMDHTPGQRQFQSLDAYKQFYQAGRTPAELESFITDRLDDHARYSGAHRAHIVRRAHELGLALASHDDASLAHVQEGIADGVAIAEFPTTLEAAAAAHDAGLAILMGAPNVVRGKSHSGNVSATDLVRAGLLDILSSDYVPFAMLQAAFVLPQRVAGLTLPQALAMVTSNPAKAAGLTDRGELAVGKRADLVRVAMVGGLPVVRGVWRQGSRVS